MRKSKGQTVDLLYTNKKEVNKKIKNKSRNSEKKIKSKKVQNNNDKINLDNEIIIGLTPKKDEIPKKQKKARSPKIKNEKRDTNRKSNKIKYEKSDKNVSNNKIKNKNPIKKRKFKFIKWIIIIIIFITAIILFLMSSVFNIKQIVVTNNSKVSSQEIIELSKLMIGTNMFKNTNGSIRNNIKANPYIENVKIKRNINGTITLDILERKPTYMLKLENAYVYINNQGYMLEISESPLELPIITGFSTSQEEMNAGNRLNVDDLSKLDDIIKIMESSKNSPLANLITEIDISTSTNYKLKISSENKIVEVGDMTNVNVKLQMAGELLSKEKGKKGKIYFQDNAKKAIFREEVSR